jgi:hypothetical protein
MLVDIIRKDNSIYLLGKKTAFKMFNNPDPIGRSFEIQHFLADNEFELIEIKKNNINPDCVKVIFSY